MRVIDLIMDRAARLGKEPAIINDATTITFDDLVETIERMRVTIERLVPPTGAIVVPANPLDQIIGLLGAMAARRVLFLEPGRIGDAQANLGWSHRLIDGDLKPTGAKSHRWLNVIEGFALVVQTSGTTGDPKFVVHDDRSLAANLTLTTSVEDELHGHGGLHPSDPTDSLRRLGERDPHGLKFLSGMSLSSIAGISMLMRSIAMGEQFVVPSSLEAQDLWRTATVHGVTNAGLPPISASRFAGFRLDQTGPRPDFLHVGVGGAFAGPSLVARLEHSLGCAVTVGYGSTELGGVAIMSRPWDPADERYGTVGRPLRGVEIELRDLEGDGGTELLVKSPSIARGIVQNDELVELAEWITTGDLADQAESGALVIAGRADFMILRSGHRIDPARIEAVIERHPLVDRAGVTSRPSRIPGNMDIVAYVSLHHTASSADIDAEIRTRCISELPTHEVPRRFVTVADIPLASDFSVNRAHLRDLVRRNPLADA